jgi:peroxiredoxin
VPELERIGFQVIAVSTDPPRQVDAHRKKNDFPFPLLSDSKMSGARALGIAFHLDDPTVAQCGKFGFDLETASGETHHELPVPAIFVIGADGKIRFEHVDPDYKSRLDPDVLLAMARAALKK